LSAAAREFGNVPAVFISYLLDGLRQSKTLELLDWEAILTLSLDAINRHDSASEDGRMCRLSVIGLVKQALAHGTSMPTHHRRRVWAVLEPLAGDPDPDPQREADNKEPRGVGLNSVRPCAVECAVLYALWLVGHRERRHTGGATEAWTMPDEVAQLLSWHLVPANEPSTAVRDLFGRYLPQLHRLAPTWTENAISAIFPAAPESERLWKAAWGGYLESGGPYPTIWPLLRSQYERHVRLLASRPTSEKVPREDQSLAFHLGALLWRGELLLTDDLMASFFSNAQPSLRGWMLHKLGEALQEAEPPASTTCTLQALWNARMAVGPGDLDRHGEELRAFGSWWISGKFNQEWSDRQLLVLGSLGIRVERPDQVFEMLAERAAAEPAKALELLSAVITDQAPDWTVVVGRESVEAVIRAALRSGSAELRRNAEELVNRLVAWGYPAFKTLLTSEDKPQPPDGGPAGES
jgi:hypothetical protein